MESVSLQELTLATGGRIANAENLDVSFSDVGIDSRSIEPGELFWALEGENHDGHNFVAEAFQRGASACVVHRDDRTEAAGPAVIVNDTLQALSDFAKHHRSKHEALVVGVTGSMGKTTAREMIHTVLQTEHTGVRSPRNFNNHIGLPLSVLQIEEHHEFAVLEMGASGLGEIRELAAIARPEVGVVTGIGPSHLAEFGSEEHIVEAKGELIESLPQTGFAVLPGDDNRVRQLARKADCRVIFVGEESGNDLTATDVYSELNRLGFRVDGREYEVPATGRHHLHAALIAVAVGREVGIDERVIADGLRQFTPAPGRCRLEQVGRWTVIDDTYNANPSSMQAACQLLKDCDQPGNRVLVCGDMLELGAEAARYHHQLGIQAAEAIVDHLIVTGRHADDVVEGALAGGLDAHRIAQCCDIESVYTVLDCLLEPETTVLVKGSRGTRMERVVTWLKQHAAETDFARTAERLCA